MTLHRIGDAPIIINKTILGTPGQKGKDGESITGKKGPVGAAPMHEVRNGELRFQNPDGTWGEWIAVPQAPAGGGPESYNTYTSVKQASFRVNRQSLTLGKNIFGVDFAGDVEIILPNGIDKRILIVVKDESNNAGTNNITLTTES